ncbi:MAG TPA: AMP-binding protein [Stellaceae bacterium]|nr:AMP-binding protein [Stellaceae bacterium]
METIGETLAHQARVQPNRAALKVGERVLTWRELDEGANRVANLLLSLGARHGDRVMMMLGNSVEFVEIYYGLAKIGCISAPVMPRSVAGEVQFICDNLRARFIFAEADSAPIVRDLGPKLTSIETMIGIGAGHGLAQDYHALKATASPAEPTIPVAPDDILTTKFTSGTTGVPKGCLRSHRNFIMAASVLMLEIPLYDNDCAIIANPLAAGMAISQLTMFILKGIRIVMQERFEPARFLDLVNREKPTLLYMMDTMMQRCFPLPQFAATDFSPVRLYHGGGREIIKQLRANPSFRAGFSFGYASSEAGGLVTFRLPVHYRMALEQPDKYDYLLDSAGTEAPLTRVECLDDDLKPVPQGEIGELAVSGPSVFRGYWERPEETEKVLRQGWLLTGDLALKDRDGVIFIKGRKREMIKTGGVNVYPAEIEPVLESHAAVVEAAVVGIPDKEWGEKVVAFVIAKSPVTETELIDHCRNKLAAYKRPKQIVFLDEFPMRAGKVVKRDLARILTEGNAR